jgi:type II restriction enzyme
MAINNSQKFHIQSVITTCLRNKFQSYKPEPASMPFHFRLLGKDRMALYSFIHSLATNFGTAIFEPVAKALALSHFANAELQQIAGKQISSESQRVIQNIIDGLTTAQTSPNKIDEIAAIRKVCQRGELKTIHPTRVDLKLTDNGGTLYLIDIKTAKPNAGNFKEFKRTLLEWVAVALLINPQINIQTLIAIPYNPYEPEPYNRWTMRGMLDLRQELKVADEFWNFLGGEGAYTELLDCFEKAGLELRAEIDEYFTHFIQ